MGVEKIIIMTPERGKKVNAIIDEARTCPFCGTVCEHEHHREYTYYTYQCDKCFAMWEFDMDELQQIVDDIKEE